MSQKKISAELAPSGSQCLQHHARMSHLHRVCSAPDPRSLLLRCERVLIEVASPCSTFVKQDDRHCWTRSSSASTVPFKNKSLCGALAHALTRRGDLRLMIGRVSCRLYYNSSSDGGRLTLLKMRSRSPTDPSDFVKRHAAHAFQL